MSRDDILHKHFSRYDPQSSQEEEAALKEILQEIILYGLSRTNFFKYGLFHGGTALRVLHDLPRFSEDLDFLLELPNEEFKWDCYFDAISKACNLFGIESEVVDRSKVNNAVKKMFLKDNSIGKILNLTFHHHARKKLLIKLEIDTNPPAGSIKEIKFLNFPLESSVAAQDLASCFAGKIHALLCRVYLKGRDWYDLLWYIRNKILPNMEFLKNAIYQQGPWAGQELTINPEWVIAKLKEKAQKIDWKVAAADTDPFLFREEEKHALTLWTTDYFLNRLETFEKYFKGIN